MHFATLPTTVHLSSTVTPIPTLLRATSPEGLRSALDPRWVLRWIYVGRLSIATALIIAAIFNWLSTDVSSTLIATIAFALSVFFTAWSAWYTVVRSGELTDTFLYGQLVFDVLLVTSVVHLTGQDSISPFAPLYIVVNACAALLLPIGSSLLLALFGTALYANDVFWWTDVPFSPALVMQAGIFVLATVGVSLINARLQAVAVSSRAGLTQARLEAADILSNIRSGVLTIDPAGVVLFANQVAADLLGLDHQSIQGRAVLDDIARIAPGLRKAFERAIESRGHTQREEAYVTLADRGYPIGVTTTSNEGDGIRIGRSITAIFQDISDQRRVEQLRHRAERLEAVAELGASLAHEIRNPLASIRSAIEQLGHSPRTTPDEQTLARLIVRESDRLSRLLGEFLDFARTRMTRIETVDLTAVARGATNLAATHPSRPEGARVECVAPDTPVRIEGDEDLLHRALFNLALNAVQAVRPGGNVRVEVFPMLDEPLPPGVQFEHGVVGVRVTDDGAGIDAEIRDRIFQPFATTKPGGSGLGLPLAHRAVEAHRGLVLVDTSARGTRFTVLLPLVQSQSPVSDGAVT